MKRHPTRRPAAVYLGALLGSPARGAGKTPADTDPIVSTAFVSVRGAHGFRVPSLAWANGGAVIALAHRTTDGPHAGATTLVARRSTDGGRSREPLRELAHGDARDELQAGAALVDRTDGDVLLFASPRQEPANHIRRSEDDGWDARGHDGRGREARRRPGLR